MAVGTPSAPDGSANLSYLFEAARDIARHLPGPVVVVNKSTVPVGTAERVGRIISELTPHRVVVASNPEFLKEGTAVDDFLYPDRVVIGTDDEDARVPQPALPLDPDPRQDRVPREARRVVR